MKKLLVLLTVSATMFAHVAVATSLDENCFGLFYDRASTIDEIDISANSQQTLYLVLINPVADSGSVQLVGGFECAIVPASGDLLLGVTFPLVALNVTGSVDNLVVGYAQGLAVNSGNGTTLAAISVLAQGNNPEGYLLQPPSPSSRPDKMVYLDLSGDSGVIVDAMPVSGSYDRPVFTFGDFTVEENRKWGDVKSLYR